MSEFYVEVVRIGKIEKHPNADTLSITEVHGGYPVIFKTGDFHEGDLAAYIPVDSLVPTDDPAFMSLSKEAKYEVNGRPYARIKAKKLRGVFSMGLVVSLYPETDLVEGQDVAGLFNVHKYESPQEKKANSQQKHKLTRAPKPSETQKFDYWTTAFECAAFLGSLALYIAFGTWSLALAVGALVVGEVAKWWNRKVNTKPNVPVYDIEGLRRHKSVFREGETVWITEKVHGCNARYVHTGRKFYLGSRTQFRERDGNVWHKVADKYDFEAKLKRYPNLVIFGEVYGDVQDLTYGVPKEEGVRFVAFDAMDLKTRKYLDVGEFRNLCQDLSLPVVPTLYYGPWSDDLANLAEGPSVMPGANHVREGIVIKPIYERTTHGLGRTFLKLAGEGYLLRKEAA